MRPVLLDINSNLSPRQRDRLLGGLAAHPAAGRAAADQPDHRARRRRAHLRRRRRRQPRPRRAGRAAGRDDDLARAHGDALEVDPAPARATSRARSSGSARATTTSRVPVTTGDELGELAASFNEMVAGLAERERIREAFGTYLDKEVAEYILSEGFTEEGVEVEVTVLFCDVRDFTEFASGATPQEVVAALNRLFEVIVPIIAGHGGHIDKFEGDGLLAVFGAPEPFPDHADRAVRAACEIGAAVNERGEAGELRVGVGVNTGARDRRRDRRRRAAQLLGDRRRRQRRRPGRGPDPRDRRQHPDHRRDLDAALARVRGREPRQGRAARASPSRWPSTRRSSPAPSRPSPSRPPPTATATPTLDRRSRRRLRRAARAADHAPRR